MLQEKIGLRRKKTQYLQPWGISITTVGSTIFLICFLFFSYHRILINEPVKCSDPGNKYFSATFINNFCYMNLTFTYKNEKKYEHAYYPYTIFLFFLLSVGLYIPQYLWYWNVSKIFDVNLDCIIKEKNLCIKTLKKCKPPFFTLKYIVFGFIVPFLFICAVLHLLCIVFYNFLSYDFINTLDITFPIYAVCRYEFFGPSGTKEVKEPYCMLTMNTFLPKIFIIIWVFFIIVVPIWFACILVRGIVFFFNFFCASCCCNKPYYAKVMNMMGKKKIIITSCDFGFYLHIVLMVLKKYYSFNLNLKNDESDDDDYDDDLCYNKKKEEEDLIRKRKKDDYEDPPIQRRPLSLVQYNHLYQKEHRWEEERPTRVSRLEHRWEEERPPRVSRLHRWEEERPPRVSRFPPLPQPPLPQPAFSQLPNQKEHRWEEERPPRVSRFPPLPQPAFQSPPLDHQYVTVG
jgi:hypothetical protein